ncbi:MAG: hypothetical protein JWN94_3957, partial [Betaproteobacteria bacterium]|nr:hypothetical protein [Betaproteobacteria bacterium]
MVVTELNGNMSIGKVDGAEINSDDPALWRPGRAGTDDAEVESYFSKETERAVPRV